MAHCFTREYIAVFMIEGYNALQQFLEYDITPAQLKHDVAVMYGALKSVFRSGKKSKETSQPERKRAQWNRCLVRHANWIRPWWWLRCPCWEIRQCNQYQISPQLSWWNHWLRWRMRDCTHQINLSEKATGNATKWKSSCATYIHLTKLNGSSRSARLYIQSSSQKRVSGCGPRMLVLYLQDKRSKKLSNIAGT